MGIHPSAYSAMCANNLGPAAPPISTGGQGRWIGLGHDQLGGTRTCSPANEATSSAHRRGMASTCSRARPRRVRGSTPWLSISSSFQPTPMPKTNRPPER